MRERTRLEASLDEIDSFERELADNLELLELAESEDDADVAGEAEGALKKRPARTARAEVQPLLSGEADANDCYLEGHAGAGGGFPGAPGGRRDRRPDAKMGNISIAGRRLA